MSSPVQARFHRWQCPAQRLERVDSTGTLWWQVLPETQPVLPCLLRRLLHQERQQEAYALAKRHAQAPHFARSLEWLLFTSLEINADSHPLTRQGQSEAERRQKCRSRPEGGRPSPHISGQPFAQVPAGQTGTSSNLSMYPCKCSAAEALTHIAHFWYHIMKEALESSQ